MAKNFDYKNLTREVDAPAVEKKGRNEKKEKKPLPFAGLGAKIKTILPAGKNGRKRKLGKGKMTGKQKAVGAGVIVVLLIVVVMAVPKVMGGSKRASAGAAAWKTATVERRSITSDLSSSGTISPKGAYNVTALASSEVITADFEEGDQVKKGQVLYIIDTSSMESELKPTQNSLERAQTSYDLAAEDYNEAMNDRSDNTYKSMEIGFIETLCIRAGDRVSDNTEIVDVYNDKVMRIRVSLLSGEAAAIRTGNQGVVTLTETGEQLLGTATSVSNMEEILIGGRLARYVTPEVENPGGLTNAHTAAVAIRDFPCALGGTFEASVGTVMSTGSSSSVEVESMIMTEGDFVNKGTAIFRMGSKSADSLVRNYKDAMDKAQESLESAQSKTDSARDSYENHTVTTPIPGTVITGSVKADGKISGGGSSGAVMLAMVYNLSQMTFEMSVDEPDIQSVQVDQLVVVVADAFENQTFSGKVASISLTSSNSNGATNYPVTATLGEVDGLLPSMNVDSQIILGETENALVVPVDSLMRGNKVYVKDDTAKKANGAAPTRFRSMEVETGLINDDFMEIVSGLSEGDVVYATESSASSSFSMKAMIPGSGGDMGGTPGGGGNHGDQDGDPGDGRP